MIKKVLICTLLLCIVTVTGVAATTAQIKTLQQNLKTLGYYTGSITGNVGTKTAAAIKAFQKAKGLSVTGTANTATINAAASAVSQKTSTAGATTTQIKTLQQNLKTLGYYTGSITGSVGAKTTAAIKSFQKAKGLTVNGTPDSATRNAATSAVSKLSASSTTSSASTSGGTGKVYKVDWFANKTSFYNKIGIKAGGQAKLTDLTTGKSLNIYIQSTGNHADAEPLTSSDTSTLCAIFGVSGPSDISYKRRPMLIEVGSYKIVCSIYGVPHGAQKITSNNYPGQFCLHFLNSKTHGSDKVDADHQYAITQATTIMKNKGYTIVTTAP